MGIRPIWWRSGLPLEYTGVCPVSASSTLAARVSLSPLSPTQTFKQSFMILRSRITLPFASSYRNWWTDVQTVTNKHKRTPRTVQGRQPRLAACDLESMQKDCLPPCLPRRYPRGLLYVPWALRLVARGAYCITLGIIINYSNDSSGSVKMKVLTKYTCMEDLWYYTPKGFAVHVTRSRSLQV